MGEQEEQKKRQRLGTWERVQKHVQVEGCTMDVPVIVLKVSYEGHAWEVPDTKKGRALATSKIHAVQRFNALLKTIQDRKLELLMLQQKYFEDSAKAKDIVGLLCTSFEDLLDLLQEEQLYDHI